jgi:ferritin-like metal-binding protein YciE
MIVGTCRSARGGIVDARQLFTLVAGAPDTSSTILSARTTHMAVKTLDELFEHELKDIYYAEHRLVEALKELADETRHREIKRAYSAHRKETQGQIKRLKQVFKMIGDVPEAEKCPGIEGLLKEKQNFTRKEKPGQEILDYYNLGAAAKAERYEITAYEGLIEIARQLGLDEAVELLEANLQEEQAALETVKGLAQEFDTGALMAEEEPAETESNGGAASKKSSAKGASKGGARNGSTKRGSTTRSGAASRKGAASKGAASKGAASKGTASKGTASKGTASKGTASKGTASKGTASKGTASKSAASTRRGVMTAVTPRRNDAGAPARATDDAGYAAEVEADDIMVAPDPEVSLANR